MKKITAALLCVLLILGCFSAAGLGEDLSPDAVRSRILAMQEEYPEGMPWTNDNGYAWKGGIFSVGYGCAGFAFGGSAADPTYTALCLDARSGLLHYEGYEITEIEDFDPMSLTRFDFSKNSVHHVKLVCENEIVVMYVDDMKALSSRIFHSTDGAHIGVFADGCSASFSNISMKISG